MSDDSEAGRGTAPDASNGADPAHKPISAVLPSSAVSELLRRLDEHRARGARHVGREVIGAGGMGEILKVRDQDLGRELAMKVLRRDFASLGESQRTRMLARFLEEAQVTGQLHHPSIVPVHELSVDAQGEPYFTMPLIRGSDFGEIIRSVHEEQPAWTLQRALGIVLKVCEALAYAHARGVIHRDVKPSNVRVGRFGETYLMDWGLAKVLGRADTRDLRLCDPALPRSTAVRTDRSRLKDESPDSPLVTMDGDVVGTPHYMSPEQARGDSEFVGPRSDVYAVGALLYHLLAGRAPYAPESGTLSPRAVWGLVLDGPPKDLAEVVAGAPGELVDIVRQAMARESGERYADMEALARDLEAYLGRRPVRAHAPTVAYALRLLYERNRSTARVGALALLVFAAVGSLLAWSASAARADQRRAQRLADDGRLIGALRGEADVLYPATPRELRRFDAWILDCEELAARADEYRAWLADLHAERPHELDPATSLIRTLEEHLARLDELTVVRADVAARRTFAAKLDRWSLREPAPRWREVCDEVNASGLLGAFELEPQIGLVPLWKNAAGCFEFWHVASGARPAASEPAQYTPRAEDGIVLVLLPGGTFEMGSPPDEPGRSMVSFETQHEVTVPPFFAAKHEVTQAQWQRAMGDNPSRYRPENVLRGNFSALHPVEGVDWARATAFAARLDLLLPSEAQWECAARAGTRTAYWWGDDVDGLEGRENVLDQAGGPNAPTPPALWNDGFARHAPVGSFAPNGFGLHDVLGNVTEWCEDLYSADPVAGPSAATDESPGVPLRAVRGGCWYFAPVHQRTELFRSAFRHMDAENAPLPLRGLRVVRDLR